MQKWSALILNKARALEEHQRKGNAAASNDAGAVKTPRRNRDASALNKASALNICCKIAPPALDKAGAWKKLNWKLDIPALKVNGSETLENNLEERYTFLQILSQGMMGASIGERMPSWSRGL